jgi:hypothetical protein
LALSRGGLTSISLCDCASLFPPVDDTVWPQQRLELGHSAKLAPEYGHHDSATISDDGILATFETRFREPNAGRTDA